MYCSASISTSGPIANGKLKLVYHQIDKHNHPPDYKQCEQKLNLYRFLDVVRADTGRPVRELLDEWQGENLLLDKDKTIRIGIKARKKMYPDYDDKMENQFDEIVENDKSHSDEDTDHDESWVTCLISSKNKYQIIDRGYLLCCNRSRDAVYYFLCTHRIRGKQCMGSASTVGEPQKEKLRLRYHKIDLHIHPPDFQHCELQFDLYRFRQKVSSVPNCSVLQIYEDCKNRGMKMLTKELMLLRGHRIRNLINSKTKAVEFDDVDNLSMDADIMDTEAIYSIKTPEKSQKKLERYHEVKEASSLNEINALVEAKDVYGEVIFTNKGQIQIIDRGYLLFVSQARQNKRKAKLIYLSCNYYPGSGSGAKLITKVSKGRCPARGAAIGGIKDGKIKLKYHSIEKHNHPPDHDMCTYRREMWKFRDYAMMNLDKKDSELCKTFKFHGPIKPKFHNLRCVISRMRIALEKGTIKLKRTEIFPSEYCHEYPFEFGSSDGIETEETEDNTVEEPEVTENLSNGSIDLENYQLDGNDDSPNSYSEMEVYEDLDNEITDSSFSFQNKESDMVKYEQIELPIKCYNCVTCGQTLPNAKLDMSVQTNLWGSNVAVKKVDQSTQTSLW